MKKIVAVSAALVILSVSQVAKSADFQAAVAHTDMEKQKRKLVYRYYDILASCSRCPAEAQDSCNSAVSEFELAYPELIELINKSPHNAYAEKLVKSNGRVLDISECKWMDRLLRASVQNELARDEIGKAIRVLQSE